MDTSLKPDIFYFRKQIYIFLIITIIVYIFFLPFCLFILKEGEGGLFLLLLGTIGWSALGAFILFFYNNNFIR